VVVVHLQGAHKFFSMSVYASNYVVWIRHTIKIIIMRIVTILKIIIIGKDTISCMQGIYTYIPETNHVPKEYNVAAIVSLLFVIIIIISLELQPSAGYCLLIHEVS
jgi:hypothetical protein